MCYSYDLDGTITNLERKDGSGSGIDNLSYAYPASGGKTINNRLNHIADQLAPNDNGKGVVGQDPDNYSYDATGNLTADVTEGLTSITWTPYNKIRELVKSNAAPATGTTTLRYLYDAAGNRVVKDYHATQNTTLTSRTWYIRDAQGTVLAIYTRKPTAGNSGSVTRTEAPIYGSSRIGQSTRTATYDASASGEATLLGTVYSRELGKRAYELVDHLGNVRATISDILVPRTATNTYDADVLTLTDYYPFGMQMDTRTWEASGVAGHRYGYNGKENDDEVKGQGNQQDYGFRIYDPRVARFLSVDPLAPDYPWYTPYQFAGNRPLDCIDLDGLERVNVSLFEAGKTGLPHLKKSEWYVVGGTVAWGSFAVAARHNTPSNPGAYQNVEDRHNYYRWAHTEASRRGSNWFGAAAIVTQWNAVGAADNINLWWLNDAAERFLQEGNRYLFSHNMRNLDGLLNGTLDRTFVDANGAKVSLSGLTGKQLDYALVQFEQTKVQEFIDSYRSSNPGIDMAKIMESINFSMTSWMAPSEIKRVMNNSFDPEKGQKAFDFGNYNHRVELGKQLIDLISED